VQAIIFSANINKKKILFVFIVHIGPFRDRRRRAGKRSLHVLSEKSAQTVIENNRFHNDDKALKQLVEQRHFTAPDARRQRRAAKKGVIFLCESWRLVFRGKERFFLAWCFIGSITSVSASRPTKESGHEKDTVYGGSGVQRRRAGHADGWPQRTAALPPWTRAA
jgi:hypothetical protein